MYTYITDYKSSEPFVQSRPRRTKDEIRAQTRERTRRYRLRKRQAGEEIFDRAVQEFNEDVGYEVLLDPGAATHGDKAHETGASSSNQPNLKPILEEEAIEEFASLVIGKAFPANINF